VGIQAGGASCQVESGVGGPSAIRAAWQALGRCAARAILADMAISLTAEQQACISARVQRGEFASIEAAARHLIDERIAERAIEEGDDLAWAKPLVEEALAEVARGDFITINEHQARNAARLAAFKD
jgi:antitoxin ParD1/3/4